MQEEGHRGEATVEVWEQLVPISPGFAQTQIEEARSLQLAMAALSDIMEFAAAYEFRGVTSLRLWPGIYPLGDHCSGPTSTNRHAEYASSTVAFAPCPSTKYN